MANEQSVWISYDLGIRGDYKGLYTLLDELGAKESGDATAFVKVKTAAEDIVDYFKNIIETRVNLAPTDRIYLIYKNHNDGKIKGVFLFGGRKRAPWEGYSQKSVELSEDF